MTDTVTRKPPKELIWGKLDWHPAVKAWTAFAGGANQPESLEVLRKGKKAATYRLVAAGPGGESIIAQHAPAARARIERTVHERILPLLTVTSPRFYGYAEDGGDLAWLFFEDLGDERFSKTDPAHRVLAARWIGSMHTGAAAIAAARELPDSGPGRYEDHLRVGAELISANLTNQALPPADVSALKQLLADLTTLERRWSTLDAACGSAPATLVHGDVQRKNMYIRGADLFLIDWETAGWGVPGPDLALVDLTTYWSVVGPVWAGVRLEDLQRLAAVGEIFRQLAAIRWVSPELANPQAVCLIRPMSWLRVFHERLTGAVAAFEREAST
jgi:hypothetical protein